MKAEPLKGKKRFSVTYKGVTTKFKSPLVSIEELRSAVEWLKQQIPNIVIDLISEDENRIMNKIDEAFEDALKEKK